MTGRAGRTRGNMTDPGSHPQGLIIANMGHNLDVETADGHKLLCTVKKQVGPVAVGDRVLIQPTGNNGGQIIDRLERRSLLCRPGRRGATRPVVANLDQVFIVFAAEPRCDYLLMDQYLVVCENRSITPWLICNKSDLSGSPARFQDELRPYEAQGYPVIYTSTLSGEGMKELLQALQHRSTILAGQSGVGKSSLTNKILPGMKLRTNAVSDSTRHGRHTTTTTTLYHLPAGGTLIDSPGVSVFGLAEISPRELAFGYREFQPLMPLCRFGDCTHTGDRGCAVVAAVERGEIDSLRYRRYIKLLSRLDP